MHGDTVPVDENIVFVVIDNTEMRGDDDNPIDIDDPVEEDPDGCGAGGDGGTGNGSGNGVGGGVGNITGTVLPPLKDIFPEEMATYEWLKSGGLKLEDGVKIPKDKIRTVAFKEGAGDSNGFQRFFSDLFGLSVTAENNFDSRHRMKVRLYNQDFIIYHSIGFTVRMQKRTLGIWWRTKAQEFRYGWSKIEVEYNYKETIFPEPPVVPNPTIENPIKSRYPVLSKNFPFKNKDIHLFYIPVAKYYVKGGDINTAFWASIKEVAKEVNSWVNKNSDKKNDPRSGYTSKVDNQITMIYPQGEEKAYNIGREVVRFEIWAFSGDFQVSYSTNWGNGTGPTSDWTDIKVKKIKPEDKYVVKRGDIYAAVKYNNEWRACRIKTE